MRHKTSEYMHWAKTHRKARYNLATSGVGGVPISDLGFDYARLEINGENSYGYNPLQSAIAAKCGVDPACVVTSQGTSMSNHLAMAALLEPGDEVLMEQPAYSPLMDAALYLQASIRRFPRTVESGFAVDPGEVQRAITPRTRLIVITNLHNPTSVWTPEPVLREIGSLARSVGAHVLVDEVYLDAVYQQTPRSSVHLGAEFLATSSLTKIYGVSGLRCGWTLAHPDLARRMQRLNDLFAATAPYPAEVLSLAAFEQLDRLRERARRVVEADRAALAAFLEEHPEIRSPRTDWGTTAFLRLPGIPADEFAERLRSRHETSVVPGHLFETPDHIRIGMGVNHTMFVEGLARIAQALPPA